MLRSARSARRLPPSVRGGSYDTYYPLGLLHLRALHARGVWAALIEALGTEGRGGQV